MTTELNKVFFFTYEDGVETALYCDRIERDEDGVITANVINGAWGLWFDGSTLKACQYKMVSPPAGFDWEYRMVMDVEEPVTVTRGIRLDREVVVPPAMARFGDYSDIIAWASGQSGDAINDLRGSLDPKELERWGSSPVVAVGYNRTDAGDHMTPSMRLPVAFDEERGLVVDSGARSYSLSEYLDRLVENQRRLCRVWLLTEDGQQHCCYWYEQDEISHSMLDHFDTVMRLSALQAGSPAVSKSPSP